MSLINIDIQLHYNVMLSNICVDRYTNQNGLIVYFIFNIRKRLILHGYLHQRKHTLLITEQGLTESERLISRLGANALFLPQVIQTFYIKYL